MASKSIENLNGIAVVIPMYNEELGAERCVKTVLPFVQKLNNRSTLLVVNDGSKDKTPEILKTLGKKHKKNFIVINHTRNKGYGAALRTCTTYAYKKGYKYVIFMDSDLTNDPKYLKRFAELYGENWDCIKASRYINGGGMKSVPFNRRVFSFFAKYVSSMLFRIGINDCTNGFRMVSTKMLISMKLKERSFPIILEELYYLKKLNATITEIPYVLTSRTNTKTNFNYTPQMVLSYLKYALKASIL